jgi:hypothetical protein
LFPFGRLQRDPLAFPRAFNQYTCFWQ